MSKLLYWNRLSILTAATRPSSADFRHVLGSVMRIGRIFRACSRRIIPTREIRVSLIAIAAVAAIPAAAQQAAMSAAAASTAAAAATARIPPRPQPKPAPPPAVAEANSILNLPGIPVPQPGAASADGAAAQDQPAGPPLTGVAAQCADLLKMATTLKTEVAKTTKDQLSVAVIRKAGQIEKLAHKMRAAQ